MSGAPFCSDDCRAAVSVVPTMPGSTSLTLTIRVTPRADVDAVVGWRSIARDELSVRIRAVPEGGKANAATLKTLACSLGIPKSAMKLVRGHGSRLKVVAFEMDARQYQRWCDSLPVRS
jgi:uncharacterized protein YggU (UPF0235/DUF167 family)